MMPPKTNTALAFINAFPLRRAVFGAFCQEINHNLPQMFVGNDI